MTGEGKHANICLDCGTTWSASELRKTLEVIREHTGRSLNLKEGPDRSYLKDFMTAIEPAILEGAETEKQASALYEKAEKIEGSLPADIIPSLISQPSGTSGGAGCFYGLFLSAALFLVAVIIGISKSNPLLIMIVLTVPLVGLFLDVTQTSGTRSYKKKLESETAKWEALKKQRLEARDARIKEATNLKETADKLRSEASARFSMKLNEFLNDNAH